MRPQMDERVDRPVFVGLEKLLEVGIYAGGRGLTSTCWTIKWQWCLDFSSPPGSPGSHGFVKRSRSCSLLLQTRPSALMNTTIQGAYLAVPRTVPA
jgi:hypothetical protein